MPICWSEATKLLITLTVLVQVWPVLDAGWFRIITYVIFTPLLHYVFFKVQTSSLEQSLSEWTESHF